MSHRRLLLSIVLLAASLLGCLSTTTPQSFTPTPAAGQLLSERSQVFFRKTAQQAEELMVNDDRTASTGDEIWTQAQGRALLRFPDLWVRIYDDTVLRTEEVTPSGIKLAMGSGAVLIGETPRALEDVTIVLGSPPRARIVLTGTLVMIAYIPSEQVVLVRAFDGKADVSVVATGRTARADSDSAEWLIVGPENQLETPSQDRCPSAGTPCRLLGSVPRDRAGCCGLRSARRQHSGRGCGHNFCRDAAPGLVRTGMPSGCALL